jgi:hypothetical protein
MDPDPAIFFLDANEKLFYFLNYYAYYFLKALLQHFSEIKSQKTVGIKDPDPDPDPYN